MRILSRYIIREASLNFFISLFAFTGILLTIRMIKLAGLVINRGVELQQIVRIFVAIVPTFLEIALPLATLLGVMLAFARLSGDSEIVVIRASGISLREIVPSVIVLGIAITFLSLVISLYLRPWGYRELSTALFEIARTKSTAGLEEAVFNKLGDLTLYAQSISHESGALEHVLVDDKREKSLRRIISGKTGRITSDPKQRTITIALQNGTIHEQVQDKYVLTAYNQNNLVLRPDELYGDQSDKRTRKNAELHNAELDEAAVAYAGLLGGDPDDEAAVSALRSAATAFLPPEESGTLTHAEVSKRLNRLYIEKGRRFSLPVSALLLALLGMSLGIQPTRAQKTWGPTLSIAIGMTVFVLYYVLFSMGITFAEGGAVHPVIGLWLPNIVILTIASYLLWMICTERWNSIAEGMEHIIRFFSRRNPVSLFRRRA